jgi:SPOR domain
MAHRRKGSRNWARGILATFWILLAGLSGVYLFSAFTDPTLGGHLLALNPAASGETTSAFGGRSSQDRELAEIKASLRELSQQVAALNAHLKLDAATAPSAPEPEPKDATEATDAAPQQPVEEPPPVQAEAPTPAETSQAEVKPIEQAAADAAQASRQPAPEAAPAPKPYEPPPVAVAPFEPPEEERAAELPAPALPSTQAEETPAPGQAAPEPEQQPAAVESAALDPIALPPAANDGSTRYGIEIGTVAKQDALRPLWREFLTNHAALVAGLQPRRVLAPDKKWRLIAGPFSSAAEAAQACALFKKASRPCAATVYAGDAL